MNIEDLPVEIQYNIFLLIPPQQALKLHQINGYFACLFDGVDFWLYRSYNEFGITDSEFRNTNLHPRLRYLQLLSTVGNKCILGSENYIDSKICVRRSARDNDLLLLEHFFDIKYIGDALIGSAEGNNFNLFQYIINKYDTARYSYDDWRDTLEFSIKNDNLDMMSYLLDLSPSIIHCMTDEQFNTILGHCLYLGAKYNNIRIINYINSLGEGIIIKSTSEKINDANLIMSGAANGNNMILIQDAVTLGANDFNCAFKQLLHNDDPSLEIMNYFIEKGVDDFYGFITTICSKGNVKVLTLILNEMRRLDVKINMNIVNHMIEGFIFKEDNITGEMISYLLSLPEAEDKDFSSAIKDRVKFINDNYY